MLSDLKQTILQQNCSKESFKKKLKLSFQKILYNFLTIFYNQELKFK